MRNFALALFALVLSVPAFAWNCTAPGQKWDAEQQQRIDKGEEL